MINARPHLERIAGYALADLGESDLISLAQNESAFEASPSAIDEGKAACSSPERYPDTEWSSCARPSATSINWIPLVFCVERDRWNSSTSSSVLLPGRRMR